MNQEHSVRQEFWLKEEQNRCFFPHVSLFFIHAKSCIRLNRTESAPIKNLSSPNGIGALVSGCISNRHARKRCTTLHFSAGFIFFRPVSSVHISFISFLHTAIHKALSSYVCDTHPAMTNLSLLWTSARLTSPSRSESAPWLHWWVVQRNVTVKNMSFHWFLENTEIKDTCALNHTSFSSGSQRLKLHGWEVV